MRLMNCIGVIVAELLYDLFDPIKFFGSSKIANHSLKAVGKVSLCVISRGWCILQRPSLPLIIEFISQGTLDTRIHVESYMSVRLILE